MTDTQTCKACGETKDLTAFEQLASGRHRGTCKACRMTTATARKRTARERAAHTERVSNARHRLRKEIRDDLWSAMHTGRARRALAVIRQQRDETHRLKLVGRAGYISVSELACRCLEREAVSRAARACKSHADTPPFIRTLELGTFGLERSRSMNALAQLKGPKAAGTPLAGFEEEGDDNDPFGEAFADWAPSWGSAANPPFTCTANGVA